MSLWSRLEFQAKTYGLKSLSKKRGKKNKPAWLRKKIKSHRKKTGADQFKPISESQMIYRDMEWMLSQPISEKTQRLLLSFKGSYSQFNRFTPKQFVVFKKVFTELRVKAMARGEVLRPIPGSKNYLENLKIFKSTLAPGRIREE